MATHTFSVPDMSCSHCERTIHQALQNAPGISGCRVDLARKQVKVDLADEAGVADVLGRLLKIGYPAQPQSAAG